MIKQMTELCIDHKRHFIGGKLRLGGVESNRKFPTWPGFIVLDEDARLQEGV